MRCFLFLIFICPIYLSAQSLIQLNCIDEEKRICTCSKGSDFSLESALNVMEADTIQDYRRLACYHHQIGTKFHKKEPEKALYHYNKSLKLREQYDKANLWKSYYVISNIHSRSHDFNKSIDNYKIAYQLEGYKTSADSINILVNLADNLVNIGELQAAVEYGKLATKVKADSTKIAHANNVLSTILRYYKNNIVKLKQAIYHAEIAINLYKSDIKKARAYNNKGICYDELGNHIEAIKLYKKALYIYKNEKQMLLQAQTLNNIAAALYKQDEYREAIKALNQSLQIKKNYFENIPNHYEYAANHENLADNYKALDNIDKALEHYQLALINLTDNFRDKDINQNPIPNDTLHVYNKIPFIHVLHLKASSALKYYRQKGDTTYLALAEKTYNTAFDFHNELQQQISTEESRLFQAEVVVPFIESALAVAYELQQTQQQIPETAYRFMEKNKATVLLQAIYEVRALQYAGLPDSLLQQEKDLRTSITFAKKQLNDARQYEEKSNINRYETLLLKLKNTYDQLIRNLENNHSEYYNLKYKQNTTTLKGAQNYLDNETALLEYFVGDSSVYVLAIEKNTAHLHRLDKPENWNKTLKDFRTSITDKTRHNDVNLFTHNAHQLYKWLLSKPLNDLNTNIKRLQIIPDAQLNYLPFGLLLTQATDEINYQNLPYLLKEKSIGYAYSTTLLLENQQRNHNRASSIYGGFAPKYNNTKYLDLPAGRENVEAQATKFKGKSFLAEQATREQFRELADQFQILHLSMHGILNDEKPLYSKLIFANEEPIHAADLYNTRLNADLAILSACNTGTGNIKKGEGVMSLSRAFTYAGCPSLVMSLWSVPDGSTATMIDTFFGQLQQGMTKDKALQTAQIAYLTEASPDKQHPVHWAGFVPSGDMQAVDFSHTWNWEWEWAVLLILFVIGGLVFFRRN